MVRAAMLGNQLVTQEELREVIRKALEARFGKEWVAEGESQELVLGTLNSDRGDFFTISVAHSFTRPALAENVHESMAAAQLALF